jgi:urease accessory protein
MLEIKAKLKIARAAYKLEVKGRLPLPFALRQGGEAQARLESGEEVALKLRRGEVLRGGDLVTASDGRVIEVVAIPEKLLQVTADSLAKLAYHLGSRHVPVQVSEGFLRVPADAGAQEVLEELGAKASPVEAPFEPEVTEPHDHDHGHEHDHDHGHDHHGHD